MAGGSEGGPKAVLAVVGSSGDVRELWRQRQALEAAEGLEAYAAHRILVTHPPLPAIHLLPAIHVLLHVLLAIDPNLLPMI